MSSQLVKTQEIAKRKKNTIRAKSNFFRTARYGLTLQEHRIIYYAILKGQQSKRPFEPVTLSIKDFMELCELKGESAYSSIRNLTKKIINRSVEVVYKNDKGDHLLQAPWLIGITYHATEGMVTIEPNKKLQPFFEGRPFTETEYYFLIRFTSQYSERLYEIIKSLNHKTVIDFDVDDLRQRMSIPETQYTNFKDLRRRVLCPSVNDINEYTDISISMGEKRGQYNKVTTVCFVVTKKQIPEFDKKIIDTAEKLENHNSKQLIHELLAEEMDSLPDE